MKKKLTITPITIEEPKAFRDIWDFSNIQKGEYALIEGMSRSTALINAQRWAKRRGLKTVFGTRKYKDKIYLFIRDENS